MKYFTSPLWRPAGCARLTNGSADARLHFRDARSPADPTDRAPQAAQKPLEDLVAQAAGQLAGPLRRAGAGGVCPAFSGGHRGCFQLPSAGRTGAGARGPETRCGICAAADPPAAARASGPAGPPGAGDLQWRRGPGRLHGTGRVPGRPVPRAADAHLDGPQRQHQGQLCRAQHERWAPSACGQPAVPGRERKLIQPGARPPATGVFPANGHRQRHAAAGVAHAVSTPGPRHRRTAGGIFDREHPSVGRFGGHLDQIRGGAARRQRPGVGWQQRSGATQGGAFAALGHPYQCL